MSKFYIATPEGPAEVEGSVWKFIGIHSVAPDAWSVTHVPSGHKVGTINASFGTAKLLAKELAGLADWSFQEMKSWRDQDPKLPQKVLDFQSEFEEFTISSSASGSNADVARAVSFLNAS